MAPHSPPGSSLRFGRLSRSQCLRIHASLVDDSFHRCRRPHHSPESLSFFQKIKVLFVGVQIPKPRNQWTPANVGLDYQTIRFGGTSGQDLEAWFIPADHPKALCIAFPGYAGSKSTLLHPAQVFHTLGYEVLLVDFHGCGGSVGNQTSIGYFEANDVTAAANLAAARWPNQPIFLYGQSMGGAAILRAVADLGVHPRAIIIESVFDRLLSTVENRFYSIGIPAFPTARILVFWGGVQNGYNAFKLNPADYATRVTCPAFVLQGGKDPRVPNAEAQNIFDHLAGPKQLEIFSNCGHCGALSGDRPRWISEVTTFLNKSLPSSQTRQSMPPS
jgi:uncharacterized protein